MPTIKDLVERGALSRIEVALDVGEQPVRLLYGTPDFLEWLNQLLAGAEPSTRLMGDVTSAQQVDQLFYLFISGKPMIYMRQFRFLRAEDNAVWELKTPDTRIFGWFLKKDCFVGVFGNWADQVKDHDLYRGYRIAIRRLRRELGVDDTLCVKGISPSGVISI